MHKTALATLALLAVALPAQTQTMQVATATATIDTAKTGAVIDRHIYGQFAEHLGTGIYEGIWVGPGSKIPISAAIAPMWWRR